MRKLLLILLQQTANIQSNNIKIKVQRQVGSEILLQGEESILILEFSQHQRR